VKGGYVDDIVAATEARNEKASLGTEPSKYTLTGGLAAITWGVLVRRKVARSSRVVGVRNIAGSFPLCWRRPWFPLWFPT
jgi:hypothetical protein